MTVFARPGLPEVWLLVVPLASGVMGSCIGERTSLS